MRVISGKFRGRQLVEFTADNIRPTTDRVKETLFNKLMGYIENARVLDLFSGTGNLGIECLSRGAAWVDFVENHKKSLGIIQQNFKLLKITEDHRVHPVDVFSYMKKYSGEPYDVVLADPPFTLKLAHEILTLLPSTALLGPESIFAIEASSKERMDEAYPGLIRLDRREFGDKHLNFMKLES